MLPVATATITEFGYRFGNLYYRPADREQWAVFDTARQDGVKKVTISYDPLWTTRVWLHAARADGPAVPLDLTDRSIAYADISFEEARALRKDDASDTANHRPVFHAGMARLSRSLKRINDAARAERPAPLTAAQSQGGKAARIEERDRERQGRERRSRPASQRPADNVVPLNQALAGPDRKPAVTERQNRQSNFLNI